jgi:hypothetical protein
LRRYAIEFLCLSVAKLMVLDRMSAFAATKDRAASWRWHVTSRCVLAIVVAGNAVGLAGNIAAATYWTHAAESNRAAAELLSSNRTGWAAFLVSGRDQVQQAAAVASVQTFCEVAVLLLVVAAFAAVGIACARRISDVLLAANASASSVAATAGRSLRLRIACTTAFVFAAFLLRSVYATMFALANQLQDSSNLCPDSTMGLCDPHCYNTYTHMARWMARTPEFQLTVVLISSPLALLVALWGMTSKQALHHMQSNKRELSGASMQDSLMNRSSPASVSRQNTAFHL